MVRLVRMTFREDALRDFLTLFEKSAPLIRRFPGCLSLELLRDRRDARHLATLSRWTSPEALEAYRHSDLFRETWAKTKPLFAEKAQAVSFDELWPGEDGAVGS